MKCIKCNEEIPAGVKFCPGCGSLTEKNVEERKISLKCDQCGGTLLIDSNKTVVACPYCGNKSLIAENDVVTIERIKTEANKEIELEKIKREDRRQQRIEEKQEETNRVKEFKKGKWSKILLVAFLFSAIVTYLFFSKGYLGEGIIALAQTGCFGISWCMGMNIIKEKRRYVHVLVAALGIIMLLPTIKSCSSLDLSANVKKIKWSTIYMGDKIPEPKSKRMEIHNNGETELWIDVHNTTEAEYYEYIKVSKTMGYTVGIQEDSLGYSAYNEEGYYLEIDYYNKSEKKMEIQLDAPLAMSEIKWAEHKVSSFLPKPEMTMGSFVVENDETNKIVLGKNEMSDFAEYCELCKKSGFDIDVESETEAYTAFDKNGNKVHIVYNSRNKEMTIEFEYPMIFETITWPIVGVGTLAPVPKSLSGKVGNDYGWVYSVYIENMTREDFKEYTQQCIEAGFNKDVSNYDDSMWGDYSDDISINVSYEGYNIMYIRVSGSLNKDYSSYTRKPERDETSDSVDGTQSDAGKTESAGTDKAEIVGPEDKENGSELIDGMRSEFKEAMDSYEAFYVEYCDVLEKYRNNPTDLSILTEYAELTERSAEMSEKFDAWDSEEMNNTELMYYLEVLGRVTKMLQSVGE